MLRTSVDGSSITFLVEKVGEPAYDMSATYGPLIRLRRVGKGGEMIKVFKFRTMAPYSEYIQGYIYERNGYDGGAGFKDDTRITTVGAFMRKWYIDELPQFWNVLTGEMSLVGPRPERPGLIQGFKHQVPHYQARHNAKPGMTGWAQVQGWRGDTDLGERIKCDLWYLENWNVMLDMEIMLLTFFKRDNAY